MWLVLESDESWACIDANAKSSDIDIIVFMYVLKLVNPKKFGGMKMILLLFKYNLHLILPDE